MAKKTLVRNQDQFLVRLPDGMRDRIKAKADRAGMSMNEAIVFVLESWFPAPKTLDQKIGDLATMVAALKRGNDLEKQVDELVDEIDTTLREIDSGILKTSPEFRSQVSARIEEWDEAAAEDANERAYDPFDDENYREHGARPPPADDDAIPFDDFDAPEPKKS
ncbi:MAG: Arc family DNA-binding protein [Mesorhizobium sp.]|nr:MAG: Arc family DNA-binding protein [Mesorhizobium sp.]